MIAGRRDATAPSLGEYVIYTKWHQAVPDYEVVLGREVHESPVSEACLAMAMQWMEECRSKHQKCKSLHLEQPMPTRVLDVGGADTERIRLVETSGKQCAWAALSYCWRGASDFVLTKATFGGTLDGIALQDFSTTFRDAIFVTRRLQIQYLWIDALCIVQDDQDDWARKAGRMKDVYSGSKVTILATNSANVHHGFLRDRRVPVWPASLVWKPDNGEAAVPVFLRSVDALKQAENPRTDSKNSLSGASRPNPLDSRGWALQEYLLSPRTLSYGEQQMTWECPEHRQSENGATRPNDRLSRQMMQQMVDCQTSEKLTATECLMLYNAWYDIVKNYTLRKLTFATDRLPALSGVASVFEPYSADRYHAGLWARDIVFGLMWRCKKSVKDLPTRAINAYSNSNGDLPSWSWASLGGLPVEFLCRHPIECTIDRRWANDAEILAVEAKQASPDPGGWTNGISIEIYAHFRAIRDPRVAKRDFRPDSSVQIDLAWWIAKSSTFKMEFQRQHRPHQDQTFAVVMLSTWQPWDGSDYAILLVVESTGVSDEFRRVGIWKAELAQDARKTDRPSGDQIREEVREQPWEERSVHLV